MKQKLFNDEWIKTFIGKSIISFLHLKRFDNIIRSNMMTSDSNMNDSNIPDPENYKKFLLAEYDNISQAHFNMVSTISTFFKHYLIIVSIPGPLLIIAIKLFSQSSSSVNETYEIFYNLIPYMFLVISISGLLILGYISNLRFDSILYARTVNGIRHFFSMRSKLSFDEELTFRVLPRSIHLPRYFEGRYFLFVVLTFAMIDSAYMGFAIWWLTNKLYLYLDQIQILIFEIFSITLFFLLHVFMYLWLAHYRENFYLRTHTIGIDIDGVLNNHREHFCSLLYRLQGIEVDPDQIISIPVHKCEGLNVSEMDEHAVFNHPDYWEKMPKIEGADKYLRRLKNIFNFRIIIFTHRPWPEPTTFPENRKAELSRLWQNIHPKWRKKRIAITKLTKDWLLKNDIPFDKLIIEMGNIHTLDTRSKVKNRFVESQRKNIRIFVEDDLFKAKKLADICDIVFLINQPYNKTSVEDETEQLDIDKLIRVDSWEEIYNYIREKL